MDYSKTIKYSELYPGAEDLLPSDLFNVGEELSAGQIKCRLCNRWCISWRGLLIHYRKKHGRNATSKRKAKLKEPGQKPLTLWDLRHGGRRLDL